MSSNCRCRNSREIHIVLSVLREEQKGGIHESCTLFSASRGLAAPARSLDSFGRSCDWRFAGCCRLSMRARRRLLLNWLYQDKVCKLIDQVSNSYEEESHFYLRLQQRAQSDGGSMVK